LIVLNIAGVAVRTIEAYTRSGFAPALIARQCWFDEAASTDSTLLISGGIPHDRSYRCDNCRQSR
jgi:hypothetical protein